MGNKQREEEEEEEEEEDIKQQLAFISTFLGCLISLLYISYQ